MEDIWDSTEDHTLDPSTVVFELFVGGPSLSNLLNLYNMFLRLENLCFHYYENSNSSEMYTF